MNRSSQNIPQNSSLPSLPALPTDSCSDSPATVVVYSADNDERVSLRKTLLHPFDFIFSLWHHRQLLERLLISEIAGRHKGSVLGMIWWVVLPLIMLTVYTFIFSVVFQAKWNLPQGGRANFAAMFFSGLIVFNILTESIGRAPGLIFENPSYVKKVVFPLEVLPAMVVGTALFNGLINITLLLLLYVWTIGVPPVSTCFLPIVLLPLVLTTLGLSWFLSSLGTFLRDLSQIISIACSLLMFLSPIFYPVEALPQTFRTIVEVSPLTVVIRQFREILFWGTFPSTFDVLTSWLIAFGIAWMGYSWFMLSKRAFADVV